MTTAYVTEGGDIFCEHCAPDNSEMHQGEADCPYHCEECEAYLDISLTSDGIDYVLNRFEDYLNDKTGRIEILKQWADDIQWYTGLSEPAEDTINAIIHA